MTYDERERCESWIAEYMTPCKNINHMHSETALRVMLQEDTRVMTTVQEFRTLMQEAGFEPADASARLWEFRIASKPLRGRPNSRVRGWTAANMDTPKRRA